MTVCVATIAEGGVYTAADRMLTSDDIEFQPNQPKILLLTNSILALGAGDAFVHAEILTGVQDFVRRKLDYRPNEWIRVRDVAQEYYTRRLELKRQRAEGEFLRPIGLTSDSFLTRQRELNSQVAREITSSIVEYRLPVADAIIAGVDTTGPHLYVVNSEGVLCHDRVGFCAIGSGATHATSLLMQKQYAPNQHMATALIMTYAAKKRAEVAPGVGDETDMIFVHTLGAADHLRADVLAQLRVIYDEMLAAEDAVFNSAVRSTQSYVAEIIDQAGHTQPQVTSSSDVGMNTFTEKVPGESTIDNNDGRSTAVDESRIGA